jgi:hypothetical protein
VQNTRKITVYISVVLGTMESLYSGNEHLEATTEKMRHGFHYAVIFLVVKR